MYSGTVCLALLKNSGFVGNMSSARLRLLFELLLMDSCVENLNVIVALLCK